MAVTAASPARYQFDMDQVRRWYDEGASVREIAKRLGTSGRTMWRHMDAAGIQMRPQGRVFPPSSRRPVSAAERAAIYKAIQEARETGERWADIAERFGRSEGTVSRIARNPEGVRREPGRGPSALLAEEKVRELHAAGLRGREIDHLLGWYENRAGEIQQRLGLDPRRPAHSIPPGELRALYDRLGTVRAVAVHLGCHENSAGRLLKAAGISPARRGGQANRDPHGLEQHLEAIREAHAGPERATAAQLAARYGVTAEQMRGFLQYRGVITYRQVTAAERAEMRRLRAEGLTLEEIGRQVGRPANTVWAHLKPGSRTRVR